MAKDDTRPDGTLVLGAGELGGAVLRGLSEQPAASRAGLSVLLRPSTHAGRAGETTPPKALDGLTGDVDVVRADLAAADVNGLAELFAGFSTVICCTGFVGGPGTQLKITQAVLQAGVDRYVPWQFGVDYDVIGRGSGQDAWDEQIDVRDVLRSQERTSWIIVSTGMFTSFLFEPSFGLVDLDLDRVHALGRWENRLTVTTPDDIGRLTAAILAAGPRIDNKIVPVAGDTLSYSDLADTVDSVLGRKVERVLWTVPELRSHLDLHPDDVMSKYRLAFAREDGVAWSKEDTFNVENGMEVTDAAAWLRAARRAQAAG